MSSKRKLALLDGEDGRIPPQVENSNKRHKQKKILLPLLPFGLPREIWDVILSRPGIGDLEFFVLAHTAKCFSRVCGDFYGKDGCEIKESGQLVVVLGHGPDPSDLIRDVCLVSDRDGGGALAEWLWGFRDFREAPGWIYPRSITCAIKSPNFAALRLSWMRLTSMMPARCPTKYGTIDESLCPRCGTLSCKHVSDGSRCQSCDLEDCPHHRRCERTVCGWSVGRAYLREAIRLGSRDALSVLDEVFSDAKYVLSQDDLLRCVEFCDYYSRRNYEVAEYFLSRVTDVERLISFAFEKTLILPFQHLYRTLEPEAFRRSVVLGAHDFGDWNYLIFGALLTLVPGLITSDIFMKFVHGAKPIHSILMIERAEELGLQVFPDRYQLLEFLRLRRDEARVKDLSVTTATMIKKWNSRAARFFANKQIHHKIGDHDVTLNVDSVRSDLLVFAPKNLLLDEETRGIALKKIMKREGYELACEYGNKESRGCGCW